MNNIVIGIWGGPGTGKSTFTAALAYTLSKNIRSVLVCSADPAVPAYAIWGVTAGMETAAKAYEFAEPLRRVLTCPDLTPDYIKARIAPHPKIRNIGLLGGFIEDTYEQYLPVSGNAAESFLLNVKKFAQITIIDCIVPQQDRLSMSALESADIVFTLIEPNGLGVGFLNSMRNVFEKTKAGRNLFIAAKADEISPVEQFEYYRHVHFDFRLPYCDEPRLKRERLDLFSEYKGQYGDTVEGAAAIVREVGQ